MDETRQLISADIDDRRNLCQCQLQKKMVLYRVPLNDPCCNAFPNFLSMGVKVPQKQKLQGTKVLRTFAPEERKFQGVKVLGLFAPRERMFDGTKVPREQKFSLWTIHSQE